MTQRSVHWGELRAPELRAMANATTPVIVPVAAMEQHGPHLPVATDSILGPEVARRAALIVAKNGPVVVTPPVWTGLSEHHMALGGTVTLDFAAFLAVLRGVVGSLHRHGFRRILLLNSHGGNIAGLRTVVEELTRDFGLRTLVTATYWHLAQDVLGPMLKTQKSVRHACEAETSMIMAVRPDLVDETKLAEAFCADDRDSGAAAEDGSYRWESFAEKSHSGALGDPRASSAEQGEQLLDAAARRLAERLQQPEFWGEAK